MHTISKSSLVKLLTGLVFLSLAACTPQPAPPPTPTTAAALPPTSTQVAATVAPSATVVPTSTPESTATQPPSPTAEISATETQGAPGSTPQPSPTSSPSSASTQRVVFDKAQLISKANIENQLMDPGHSFTMSWTWKNVANTTWTTDYAFILYGGDPLGSKTRIAFPGKVNPGETLELSVDMKVPDDAHSGSYHSFWALVNQNGDLFNIVGLTIQVK
ncbi:MAG TPA: NBR1-Ig-like domain-containing protein [Anaerolineaceae bacterium]|nr:NBR1-Ig-like domain-containing protein [Anaerolineaceae bacterium]